MGDQGKLVEAWVVLLRQHLLAEVDVDAPDRASTAEPRSSCDTGPAIDAGCNTPRKHGGAYRCRIAAAAAAAATRGAGTAVDHRSLCICVRRFPRLFCSTPTRVCFRCRTSDTTAFGA